MRPNFLETANPFNLAAPPAWFLAALAAYDSSFVIFPSEKEPLYRMGRYGRYGHGLLRALKNNPDTAICVAHRIWPWKSILPAKLADDWQKILFDVRDYDTQDPRFASDPGASIDAYEDRIEMAQDADIAATLDAMNGDTYRTMKLTTGQRVGGGGRPRFTTLGTAQGASRRPAHRPTGSGAGAMFTGRA